MCIRDSHMTGQRKLDRTYASRSHLMNLRTGRWDSVLLDIFGIEKNKLCDLIDPGELHGYTNEKFAESTRLKTVSYTHLDVYKRQVLLNLKE